ncbi:hypothetical protein RJ40_10095 [Methanofollis aquaemaris]|uniref:Uncharacterized protein n=1 Tax=Methanofollis aquaemaris TaxID=126734 RepID=A0A8A3S805_9EURY|nr:hypothetical protein [Methanofollis aquaemaris]QSZ67824.1 hypothetical protein RJ40_10095 [Methanofollis aquaemaris]
MTGDASGTESWLDRPGVVLMILLAGLLTTAILNLGGRGVATVLMTVLAVLSALVVYFDARAIGAGKEAEPEQLREIRTWKPQSWAIWVLLFWPFFLPYYLWMRNTGMMKNIP